MPVMPRYHDPVLCEESLDLLANDRNGTYVDGTLGGGGHAFRLLERLGPGALIVGLDVDQDALEAARTRLAPFAPRVSFVRENFRAIKAVLARLNVRLVHGILLDLGVSSYQLDADGKGFSFRTDERLDMRMDARTTLSAFDVVNTYDEERLANLLFLYGEEHESRKIARLMVRRRPVETTGALASIVESAVGQRFLMKSLARVFQAVRIEVNDELESLREALGAIPELLAPGGRCAVISYHSLEDRMVKNFLREESADSVKAAHKLLPDTPRIPRLKLLTKKPIVAGDREIALNPRSRSAKLRGAERTAP
jgi:16S rRNA (cytosine1402-N4)-methyltransferase